MHKDESTHSPGNLRVPSNTVLSAEGVGDSQENLYVSLRALNQGDNPAVSTSIAAGYFQSCWYQYLVRFHAYLYINICTCTYVYKHYIHLVIHCVHRSMHPASHSWLHHKFYTTLLKICSCSFTRATSRPTAAQHAGWPWIRSNQ